MTAAHRRAADRERQAAALLGSTRVRRRRFERAPDVVPISFVDGTVVVPEVKTRARLPRWLTGALAQATGYAAAGAVPLIILSEIGGAPLALLPLADFARLVGLRAPADGEQLLLVGAREKGVGGSDGNREGEMKNANETY